MRSITIMYDSLCRHMLSAYGCTESITPNFKRLSERTLTYDSFYCGSLPCIPARREMHTGRYNFLHRSWGPLEPYDKSAYQILSENGIYTHMVSDHAHYWHEGSANFNGRFSTYEFIRGQEGDLWNGDALGYEGPLDLRRQERINRQFMTTEEDYPHVRTFRAGMRFLENNWQNDNWHLHLEYFDPHEPFFAPEKYKAMYGSVSDNDWPPCRRVEEGDPTQEYKNNYMALLTMCDTYLGYVLDFMDAHDMWKDTMLMVNTDHGFMMGEHGFYCKNIMPVYEELSHLPFFLWDPVGGVSGERRAQIAQTTDIAPTLLSFHGKEIPKEMQGVSLLPSARDNAPMERKYVLFGLFGKHINITDGRYVYMRMGRTDELNMYTLMPVHMFTPFSAQELRGADRTLTDSFSFTDGMPLLKIPTNSEVAPHNSIFTYEQHREFGDLLFDLQTDPKQEHPIRDEAVEKRMLEAMKNLMRLNEAPVEQYARMGL